MSIFLRGFNVRGLVAPVFTPFNDDLTINCDIIPEYLQWLVEANIKSILVNGTTGEGMSQGVEERKTVAQAWVSAARALEVDVMVQVGGAALPDVLQLARHAAIIQADAILVLPELYSRPRNTEQLVSYLELVSKAASNIPLLYYHFPVQSGVEVNVHEFVDSAVKRISNFQGLKCNLSEGAEVILEYGHQLSVFCGNSYVLAPAILSGLDSSIATLINLQPELCAKIVEAAKDRDVEAAKRFQSRLNMFTDILTSEGDWVPVMKAGMEILSGIKVGPVRPPLVPMSEEKKTRLRESLTTTGFLF